MNGIPPGLGDGRRAAADRYGGEGERPNNPGLVSGAGDLL